MQLATTPRVFNSTGELCSLEDSEEASFAVHISVQISNTHHADCSSLNESSSTWIVYCATSPSGKNYVGVTSRARRFTEEHRLNQQDANRRVPNSERLPKRVRRSDGAVYLSMAAAARDSELSVAQVRWSIQKNHPTQQGFSFARVTTVAHQNS